MENYFLICAIPTEKHVPGLFAPLSSLLIFAWVGWMDGWKNRLQQQSTEFDIRSSLVSHAAALLHPTPCEPCVWDFEQFPLPRLWPHCVIELEIGPRRWTDGCTICVRDRRVFFCEGIWMDDGGKKHKLKQRLVKKIRFHHHPDKLCIGGILVASFLGHLAQLQRYSIEVTPAVRGSISPNNCSSSLVTKFNKHYLQATRHIFFFRGVWMGDGRKNS